jgi:hypothetical protein
MIAANAAMRMVASSLMAVAFSTTIRLATCLAQSAGSFSCANAALSGRPAAGMLFSRTNLSLFSLPGYAAPAIAIPGSRMASGGIARCSASKSIRKLVNRIDRNTRGIAKLVSARHYMGTRSSEGYRFNRSHPGPA